MPSHLLLVDDDADDIELFGEALQEADSNATFQSFNDASELIDRTKRLSVHKPDVIFLDINMSSINGWDCLSFIRQHEFYKGIPVIMYSTSSHKKEVAQALLLGAAGFVTKPSNYKDLIDMLKMVINIDAESLKQKLAPVKL